MSAFGSPGDDETSPEIIEDLRAIGALSPGEARELERPAPPERQVRWEERIREPGRGGGAYDAEMRAWKDAVYGRNREGPPPSAAGVPFFPDPNAARPPERTPGISFEEPRAARLPAPPPATPEAPERRAPAPASAPRGVVPRARQVPPRPAPVQFPAGAYPPYPVRPERRTCPPILPGGAAPAGDERADARRAGEEARRLEAAREEFLRDFRREHPGASEGDAGEAWEARRRVSTIDP
jgi:hypothetical protein